MLCAGALMGHGLGIGQTSRNQHRPPRWTGKRWTRRRLQWGPETPRNKRSGGRSSRVQGRGPGWTLSSGGDCQVRAAGGIWTRGGGRGPRRDEANRLLPLDL